MFVESTFKLFLILAGIVALERLVFRAHREAPVLRAHWRTDAAYWLFFAFAKVYVSLDLLSAPFTHERFFFWVPASPWPAGVQFLAALLLIDAMGFLSHAANHRWRVLWELHKTHHSTRLIDALSFSRRHPLEYLVFLPFLALPYLFFKAMAFDLGPIFWAWIVFEAWEFFQHANVELPLSARAKKRFGWFVLLPEHHRVHHLPSGSRRNFGVLFSWWDRLNGSYALPQDAVNPTYGVPGEIDTHPQSLGAQISYPLKSWSRSLSR